MDKTICELFAGVGGFRLGFDRLNNGWETVWFSQWEPNKKKQWAYDCYVNHFGNCPDINGNITTGNDINEVDKTTIPDHTLLVGGFPCQSYSIASTLKNSKGIEGEKGVLWWQIRDTLEAKNPPFVLLENVDRLLKSPAKQRGRDFGVMLKCFHDLDYDVEWRVINAAQYGGPQRRRRVFIFAYKRNTNWNKPKDILKEGFFAKTFPIEDEFNIKTTELDESIGNIFQNFDFNFRKAGYMTEGKIVTSDIKEIEEAPILLKDIIESDVDEHYYISDEKMPKWVYLKGAKKIPKVAKNGYAYTYSEGPVGFPDDLDKPARTMLTSEGSVNRSSHALEDPETGRIRILTPIEAERIQGFDDNWTEGMSERMRYFVMGNALVVPMITKMGKTLEEIIEEEK